MSSYWAKMSSSVAWMSSYWESELSLGRGSKMGKGIWRRGLMGLEFGRWGLVSTRSSPRQLERAVDLEVARLKAVGQQVTQPWVMSLIRAVSDSSLIVTYIPGSLQCYKIKSKLLTGDFKLVTPRGRSEKSGGKDPFWKADMVKSPWPWTVAEVNAGNLGKPSCHPHAGSYPNNGRL